MAVIRIDPSSADYQRFTRLYEAARALRPSEINRWNGELHAAVGDRAAWGSLQTDGSFKLSKELVLDKLGPDSTPQEQVQALATVLHEANHARVEVNAPDEPNAVLSRHSKALDEGLTEWVSINDVGAFAEATGYGELPDPKVEYPAAYNATESLLEYAAGNDGMDQLAGRALDAPVVMRWDVIADEIVQNRLGDVVPSDAQHQQAARAELINAMTQPSWEQLDRSAAGEGPEVARETTEALGQAEERIRAHYAQSPSQPYPAKTPNVLIAKQLQAEQQLRGSQDRIVTPSALADVTHLPPPNAADRVERPQEGQGAGRHTARQAGEMRFLSGQAPAAHATRHGPSLGNGARGAGSPAATHAHQKPQTPARGE